MQCLRLVDTDGGNGESTGGNTGGETNSGSTGQNPVSSNTAEVRKEIEKGENAPETTISMSESDLASVVLTEEEKQQAENGLDIKILLTVTDAGNSVSEEEKKAAEGALGSYEMGQYLDISLFKVIGETHNRITETAGMIQITIAIPESLKSSDNAVHREYMIIRVHNGETRILADKDNDADTITIETDRFSTYALAYKDSPAEQGNEKDKEPKTGDTEPIILYATIAMIAGFAYLLLYFADHGHGMTEKQKKELVDRIIRWAHLEERGFVRREKQGKINYYSALVKKDAYLKETGRNILKKMFGGSLSNFAAALYMGEELTEEDVRELQQFIDSKTKKEDEKKEGKE